MELSTHFKTQVLDGLRAVRANYGGSDATFAKQWGINPSVWSRLKNGESGNLLKETAWLTIGRKLNISTSNTAWNIVRTDVFNAIEEDVLLCKAHSMSLMFVDECEIGKTETAKYLAKTVKNCFHIDCSAAKTKSRFIREFARVLGLETGGRIGDLIDSIKYALNTLEKPVVIFDEAGDLEYSAFLEIKSFWNATELNCGFYMMGADGLRAKIKKGIENKKVGFRENFSRFGSKYMSIVPKDRDQRTDFYKKLINDVLQANVEDKNQIPQIINKCLAADLDGHFAALRRAKNLLKIGNA